MSQECLKLCAMKKCNYLVTDRICVLLCMNVSFAVSLLGCSIARNTAHQTAITSSYLAYPMNEVILSHLFRSAQMFRAAENPKLKPHRPFDRRVRHRLLQMPFRVRVFLVGFRAHGDLRRKRRMGPGAVLAAMQTLAI